MPLQGMRRIFGALAILSSMLFAFSANSRGEAESAPPHTTLVFFADRHVNEAIWPAVFAALREDLHMADGDQAMAALDPNAELVRGDQIVPGNTVDSAIVIRLEGRCDVLPQSSFRLAAGPLGWVDEVHGVIQPFVYIDCRRLALFLSPRAVGLSQEQRTEMMGRAIAHITLHEWLHVARQSAMHGSTGVSQAELTAEELVARPTGPVARVAHGR